MDHRAAPLPAKDRWRRAVLTPWFSFRLGLTVLVLGFMGVGFMLEPEGNAAWWQRLLAGLGGLVCAALLATQIFAYLASKQD